MRYVRMYVPRILPGIVWTLVLSLCYIMGSVQIENIMISENAVQSQSYYMHGLCLFLSYGIIKVLMLKSKNIFQYLCGSTIVLTIVYYFSPNYLFFFITLIMWFVRLIKRISGNEKVIDELNYSIIGIFVIAYIISAYGTDIFLQKVTLYHGLLAGLFIHTQNSLLRLEEYIDIRKNCAYMPINRIAHTGVSYILLFLAITLIVIIPVLENQYEFVEFKPLEIKPPEVEEELVVESEKKSTEEGGAMDAFLNNTEQNYFLRAIWDIIGKITMYITYVVIIYWIIKGIYLIIIRFQGFQVEDNDVIESLYTQEDQVVPIELVKKNLSNLFYLNEEKRIRRQYKKKLKKYNPKMWQTPAEMEKMANISIEELHNQYEKVRYGK